MSTQQNIVRAMEILFDKLLSKKNWPNYVQDPQVLSKKKVTDLPGILYFPYSIYMYLCLGNFFG